MAGKTQEQKRMNWLLLDDDEEVERMVRTEGSRCVDSNNTAAAPTYQLSRGPCPPIRDYHI